MLYGYVTVYLVVDKPESLPFRSSGSHYFHFLTENEIENASIFDAIFQSENGKLSHNVKPCLRYNLTGIWFYCVSKQHGATTFCHIIFCIEFGRCTHRTSKIGDIGACWNIGESASASRRCRCCKNRICSWRGLRRPQDDGG